MHPICYWSYLFTPLSQTSTSNNLGHYRWYPGYYINIINLRQRSTKKSSLSKMNDKILKIIWKKKYIFKKTRTNREVISMNYESLSINITKTGKHSLLKIWKILGYCENKWDQLPFNFRTLLDGHSLKCDKNKFNSICYIYIQRGHVPWARDMNQNFQIKKLKNLRSL